MKLAIVGSRGFKSLGLVGDFIKKLKPTTKVVSGGARGVDQHAIYAAQARGLEAEVFQADWKRHGKAAGPYRNEIMISSVDGVVAFWDGTSKGTQNAIHLATEWQKWLRIYFEDGTYQQLSKGAFK